MEESNAVVPSAPHSSAEWQASFGPWELSVDATDDDWRARQAAQMAAAQSPVSPPAGIGQALLGSSAGWGQPVPPQPSTMRSNLSLSQRAATYEQIPPQQAPATAAWGTPPAGATPASQPTSSTPVLDAATLERLANRIVYAVLDRLNDDGFVEKFTQSRELLADNRQLAAQLQQQVREKKQQDSELAYLRQQLSGFKKIVGNLYLKMD